MALSPPPLPWCRGACYELLKHLSQALEGEDHPAVNCPTQPSSPGPARHAHWSAPAAQYKPVPPDSAGYLPQALAPWPVTASAHLVLIETL